MRRLLLTLPWTVLIFAPTSAFADSFSSPSGNILADVSVVDDRLTFSLTADGTTVIEPSPLGFVMNGSDRGTGITLGQATGDEVDESFPSRHGVHALAKNHYREWSLPVTHQSTGESYVFRIRAYDSGIAFRYEVDGSGKKAVTAESTGFMIPAGTRVFSQPCNAIYESVYSGTDIGQIGDGTTMGPPVVGRLSQGIHFAITQSGSGDGFSNPFLTKAPGRLLQTSYVPNGDGSQGMTTTGKVRTPWSVITAGSLDTLLNSDIVEGVAPAPDPSIFPEGTATSWARPGRSVWNWMSRFPGGLTAKNSKLESRWASRLGFEYNTVDDGWAAWNEGDPWDEVAEVIDASNEVGVKVLMWIASENLATKAQRTEFFGKLEKLGAAGFKADFFDFQKVSPAAKERVQLIEDILKEAARHRLMVDLHGTGKPLGQFRTYPNLLSVEGIHGKEAFPDAASTVHEPLTRLLAGPADFTPLGLQGRLQGQQTQAFEIASVAAMTGPLITYAERADRIAHSPFASVITAIPCMWDETRVLPETVLGESCVMARRAGDEWYVLIMNAGEARNWKLELPFLKPGVSYQAEIVRDDASALEYGMMDSQSSVKAETAAGGGFVMRLSVPDTRPISALPFQTSFSTARGSLYAEHGRILSTEPWACRSLAGRLPDEMWNMTGDGLVPSLDTTDAWLGGASIKVEGTLQDTSDLELFSADLRLTKTTRLSAAFKTVNLGKGSVSLGLRFKDAPGSPAFFRLDAPADDRWATAGFDLAPFADRTLSSLFLRFEAASRADDFRFHFGGLGLREEPVTGTPAPRGFRAEEVEVKGLENVSALLHWQAAPGDVSHYSIYQKNPLSGKTRWLGATSELSFPVTVTAMGKEDAIVFEIAAAGTHGVFSKRLQTKVPLPERPAVGAALKGTVIGTPGSYGNQGNTRENVFDGDPSTHFDAPEPSGGWAGLDLGSAPSRVAGIRVFPREGWGQRMVGGVLEGANESDFSDAVTLATLSDAPADGVYNLIPVDSTEAFRYLRYVSPDGGYCNVAEITFHPPAP
ncbi:glycoside hydrolase family 97 protein [Haloferula sargassicola]|uniref:Alpha-galactosidase n=1 Tax=Haloferula sargassicola TaxID=490096 RepID=A0ABP9URH4_9BACT